MKADVKNVKTFTHLKDNLKLKDEELPFSEQLTRFRCNFKRKRVNEIAVKDRAHFISWIENHNSDPQKPNELFVVNYKLQKNNFIFILCSLVWLWRFSGLELFFLCWDRCWRSIVLFDHVLWICRDLSPRWSCIRERVLSLEGKVSEYHLLLCYRGLWCHKVAKLIVFEPLACETLEGRRCRFQRVCR